MTAWLLLSVLATVPQPGLLVDCVDVVEINHFYDENGKHVFDQVIFYNWDHEAGRHQVVAWRLWKSGAQWPAYDRATGRYVSTWHDGDYLRRVSAGSRRETYTQFDPELIERPFLPKDLRRELARPFNFVTP